MAAVIFTSLNKTYARNLCLLFAIALLAIFPGLVKVTIEELI